MYSNSNAKVVSGRKNSNNKSLGRKSAGGYRWLYFDFFIIFFNQVYLNLQLSKSIYKYYQLIRNVYSSDNLLIDIIDNWLFIFIILQTYG